MYIYYTDLKLIQNIFKTQNLIQSIIKTWNRWG